LTGGFAREVKAAVWELTDRHQLAFLIQPTDY
jgi:hypothetical protein